jgi:hypothetical protein
MIIIGWKSVTVRTSSQRARRRIGVEGDRCMEHHLIRRIPLALTTVMILVVFVPTATQASSPIAPWVDRAPPARREFVDPRAWQSPAHAARNFDDMKSRARTQTDEILNENDASGAAGDDTADWKDRTDLAVCLMMLAYQQAGWVLSATEGQAIFVTNVYDANNLFGFEFPQHFKTPGNPITQSALGWAMYTSGLDGRFFLPVSYGVSNFAIQAPGNYPGHVSVETSPRESFLDGACARNTVTVTAQVDGMSRPRYTHTFVFASFLDPA